MQKIKLLNHLNSIVLITVLVFTLTSCVGYRLGNNKPNKFKDIKSLSVPIIGSDVIQPKLQSILTNSIIRSIQEQGSYQIRKEKDSDASLIARIKQINRKQLRANRENVLETTEMEFSIDLEYKIINNNTGEIIEKGIATGKSTSYLNANFQLTESRSLRSAAEKVAITLTSKLSEGY
jgi:hypothetical protein